MRPKFDYDELERSIRRAHSNHDVPAQIFKSILFFFLVLSVPAFVLLVLFLLTR